MMNKINRAIKLATEVHDRQCDLGGNSYILHPVRVLAAVEYKIRDLKIEDPESVLCSAILHDCIEDSDDEETMRLFIEREFGQLIYKQVDTLTRRPNETWKHYITRIKENWAPRIIKMADLDDNMDNSRLKVITEKDLKRTRMYEKAFNKLVDIEENNG